MRTRWERLGALAVAMTLLAGGAMALDVRPAAAAPLAAPGAGIDAPAQYRLQQQATDDEGAGGSEAQGAVEGGGAAENETGDDKAVDGVDCVQEGEHGGENAGC